MAHPLWNPWANDRRLLDLYRRRCRREAEEMTCAAQAAEILAPLVSPGETLLDAGCGGGYYLWSFAARGIPVEYHGLDHTPEMIELARAEMAAAGTGPERFIEGDIEDLDRPFDHVLCFNTLTNAPHYARPLERLLIAARRTILLRESLGDDLVVNYTPDSNLDEGSRHIRVYHNTYPAAEVIAFMEGHGFAVEEIPDRRSGGAIETICGIEHRWRILLGRRRS